jgi:hypothetical protein
MKCKKNCFPSICQETPKNVMYIVVKKREKNTEGKGKQGETRNAKQTKELTTHIQPQPDRSISDQSCRTFPETGEKVGPQNRELGPKSRRARC